MKRGVLKGMLMDLVVLGAVIALIWFVASRAVG